MKFDLEGKVVTVFEVKHISDRFSKREFVVEAEDGRYSQLLLFESSGRAMEDLDDVKEGDAIRVHFNIRGREWRSASGETKYFNSLHAWKVERFGETKSAPSSSKTKPTTTKPEPAPAETPIDDGEIPF